MKKILIPFILVLMVLSGCIPIPFIFNIPSTDELFEVQNIGISELFNDFSFDQLGEISELDKVTLDYLRIDLEVQATPITNRTIGDAEITVYASTTKMSTETLNDALVVASSTFNDSLVSLTLDSSISPAFSKIIDYINNGGRVFHIAVLIEKASDISEISGRIKGGVIKGKFKIIP